MLRTCVRDRSPPAVAIRSGAVTSAAQVARRTGATVEIIPETEDGDIDLAALEGLVRREPRPALISISHVPTSSGALQKRLFEKRLTTRIYR